MQNLLNENTKYLLIVPFGVLMYKIIFQNGEEKTYCQNSIEYKEKFEKPKIYLRKNKSRLSLLEL